MCVIYQAYGSCSHALPSQHSRSDEYVTGGDYCSNEDGDHDVEHAFLGNSTVCQMRWWLRALGRSIELVAVGLLMVAGSAFASHLGSSSGIFREVCISLSFCCWLMLCCIWSDGMIASFS
jgi:hypothetical protein